MTSQHATHPDVFDSTCPTCWSRANDRADPLTSFEDEQPWTPTPPAPSSVPPCSSSPWSWAS